jgi:FkbM family methyltransferase
MQSEAKIVSFEPNMELANKVAKLFSSNPCVTVRPYGLSDTAGMFDLFVPYYGKFAYPGLASVSEHTARSWLSPENLYFFNPSNVHVRSVTCRLETLDSQCLAPYFIKIDVQGAEYSVLCGGRSTLSQHQPILLVETGGDPRILSFLKELDYSEYEFIDGRFVEQQSKGVNSFFMTKARRAELTSINNSLFATKDI